MITLKSATLRRGAKIILQNANFALHAGEKAALIGRNGAGKSSLFALLTGRLQTESGDADMPKAWRWAEVAQSMPQTNESATDFVLAGDVRLNEAQAALHDAETRDDGHAMALAHAQLAEAGAFDAKARAQALLMGLGFRSDQWLSPVDSFSGGWRMRLQLARALMCPADVLFLDEPTNHLDLDALVWLEGWLQRFEGALLIISHDRDFLDAITRVTLHLDNTQLTRYSGNYSAFEAMHAERLSQQQFAFDKQKEHVAHLQRFIDRFKAKASKAKQAQSRVKALERLEKVAPVLTQADFAFEFLPPDNLPNPMLVMRDLVCGYPPAPEEGQPQPIPIVRDVTRSVLPGQRIGILGANGQGKSTLIKTLVRLLPALDGTLTEGKGLRIGYFAQQEMDVLRPDEGPLAHFIALAKTVSPHTHPREQELRDFLGRFRFTGEMVHQTVGSLSGGEKARLVLAMLVWQRPNLLLLDEPTNHLDLVTRQALSLALNEFEGSMLLVSHDRALLREVCDEFWLVSRGGVAPFDGDLDDYQRWLLDQAKIQAKTQTQTRAQQDKRREKNTPPLPSTFGNNSGNKIDRKVAAEQRQRVAPLKKELTALETRIDQLNTEIRNLENAWSPDALPSADDMARHGKTLKHAQTQLEVAENRWLELSELLQAPS